MRRHTRETGCARRGKGKAGRASPRGRWEAAGGATGRREGEGTGSTRDGRHSGEGRHRRHAPAAGTGRRNTSGRKRQAAWRSTEAWRTGRRWTTVHAWERRRGQACYTWHSGRREWEGRHHASGTCWCTGRRRESTGSTGEAA